METVPANIAGATVLFEIVDDEVNIVDSASGSRLTEPASLPTRFTDVFASVKASITAIAGELVTQIRETPPEMRPAKVEVSMGLAVSAKGRLCIVTAKTQGNFRVTLTWDLSGDVGSTDPSTSSKRRSNS